MLIAALATVLFVMASATGTSGASGAQAHDDHGDHDAHENPTTTMPPSSSTTSPPQPGSQTTKIRYGPYNVPGAPTNPDGTHGHAHTGNRFQFFIRKPCTNCYLTGITANLV
ncbi:MAG TPA: hypothetical protein VFB94_23285, partial [Acidimicrobiales bacterium]|nr:hypothetical protein [Acidimicrobiales bacterium]